MSAAFVMIMFAVLLLLAVPISMALAAACIMPSVFDASFTASATYIVRAMFNALNSFPMLAVPMFILSGILMARGGISRRLFDLFSFLIGKRTAGLPCAVIVTCLFYGAISGSGVATVAAVGSMTLPILLRLGYEKKFCVAIIAVAGSLGVIIPPSIPFIMYGLASGESVSDLFTAGIIPGVLIALLLMTYAVYHCKKYGEDKEKIAAYIDELHGRGFVSVMKESFLAVLSPVEAAVISVFYALLIGLVVYKEIKPSELYHLFLEAVGTYTPILFIMAAAIAFSRVLTLMQVPQNVSTWILANFSNKVIVLLVINVFLLIVGMFMDTTPAILILTPILLPIVKGFGMTGIHFGVMMVVNLAIGYVTPPIGVNLFVASAMTSIPVMDISKKAIPLICMFIIALLLITFIPAISLVLV